MITRTLNLVFTKIFNDEGYCFFLGGKLPQLSKNMCTLERRKGNRCEQLSSSRGVRAFCFLLGWLLVQRVHD